MTLFRIIAHNPNNGRVRPLTSLYELITINTLGKVVSSDKRSNPKQIMNGEEDVCADCSTRSVIENPVCENDASDDEIPELIYLN